MKDHAGLRRICIICFIGMLVMLIVHIQVLVMFNQRKVNIHGNDSTSEVYMEIDPRNNSTSRWLKRDYEMPGGQKVNLIGQTIDGTLNNNSGDTVQEWVLRINIAGDCFINQAWTGTAEIHQTADDGRKLEQTLDLRDYTLTDVSLQYKYDGDLLIPLKQGDYIVYHPNVHDTEMPLKGGSSVTIGMIFYFLDDIDLSDYDLSIQFHRGFTQGWSFFTFIAAAVLWILSSVVYSTSVIIYRNAQKQEELRRTGLSYMSELYEAIYIIHLPTSGITPVAPGDYLESLRARISDAKELLYTAVGDDAADEYRDAALAFVDLDTLAGRMQDRASIVCEFVSKVYGWCCVRFFAMDRTEGKPLENVIFAVQDINDERSEMKNLTDRLVKAENVRSANDAFLSRASRDLRAPVQELISMDEQVMQETDPGKIRKLAGDMRGTMERILLMISGLEDRAAAEGGAGEPVSERYSLRQVAADAFRAVQPIADRKRIRLEPEISETIPDGLAGDPGRLREACASMLAHALNTSAGGSVRLSVFGRVMDESVHLLVSVRSDPENGQAPGTPEGGKPAPEARDLDMEIAESMAAGMDSRLKSVRSADAWQNMYFEIDQRIADPAPAGRAAAEDTER